MSTRLRFATYALPLVAFAFLAALFAWRLGLAERGMTPDLLPSPLIGRTVPTFDLETIEEGKRLTSQDLKGKVSLVVFFASWCPECQIEHPQLIELGKRSDMTLYGMAYKDPSQKMAQWLAQRGNPYVAVGQDTGRRVAMDFGVYAVPESYLIDKTGTIRLKHTGALTADFIDGELLPLVAELNR
ncbi:MAG: DsbE family thiol:disulfide interchange protein [Bdellovibrionales bacterium]